MILDLPYPATQTKAARHCRRCPAHLCRRNKTGLCRECHNRDPAIIAKRGRGISAARLRRLATDPEFAAQQREHGRWLGLTQNGNARMSEATRRAVGLKLSDRALPWCPRARREEYRSLIRNKGLSRAEARAVIEADITPFERQLQAIRNGAGIIERRPIVTSASPFSLTGISEVYAG